jgi:two-component system chemotaxis response regulator CheB
MLDDGTLGLWEVKDRGGVAIVQDPADAEFPDMPANASRGVEVDHRVSLDEMPALLDRLAREPAPARSERAPSLKLRKEVESIMQDQNFAEMDRMGTPTVLTCPSCHGALWELHNGKLVSYRCHVGHAFTPASLDEEQSEELEKALTAALRALKERAETTRRVAQRLEGYGPSEAYLERIEDYEKAAEVLRRLLYERPGGQGP